MEGPLDLSDLLRRRQVACAFRAEPIERRRLDAVLEAGRYLPFPGPPGCRSVAIEAPAMRADLLASLRATAPGVAPEAILAQAPVLVALCDASGGGLGRAGSWMAAAQMALAAEHEGLAAIVVPGDGACEAMAALSLPADWRLEALLALGRPGPRSAAEIVTAQPEAVESFLAAVPPPGRDSLEGGDRDVLTSFMEIASATAAVEDMDGVLETIARALGRLFPVDGAALGLREEGGIAVREILRRGEAVRRQPLRLPADASHLMGWVMLRGRPLWRNDLATELRFEDSTPRAGMRSDMVIPLRARGQITGAFQVACRKRHAFDPEDFEVLQRCADVTAVAVETQRLLQATRRLSETDGLTGVCNHRHFLRLLDQEAERARRTERPVSLIMIDIDDFKRFNDTHGHQTGDEVLRHVAQVVSRLLRRSDVVARYGGEEFAVVLPEAGAAEAVPIALSIRAEVEKNPLALASLPRSLPVTISLGVASLPAEAEDGADLVAAADRALYQAKRGGKNRVFHPSILGSRPR